MKKLFTIIFLISFFTPFVSTKAQTISTYAGSTQGYAEGTGATARFNRPYGIAFDGGGAVIVTDQSNYRVRMIYSNQQTALRAGSGSEGNSNGTVAGASFGTLAGIARDGFNNSFVCDANYNVIKKITATGEVTTYAGGNGQGNADGHSVATAQFDRPYGIACDAAANTTLYVADTYNHRIRVINSSFNVSTLAGSTEGYTDATGTNAQFRYPMGITVDNSNNVYVIDGGGTRLRKITPAGVVTTLASGFSQANCVTVDNSGNLYVGDATTIKKVTPTGTVSIYAGAVGVSGNTDGDVSVARFWAITGITIDKSNNILYVTDNENHRIRRITPPVPATVPAITGISSSTNSTSATISYYLNANNGATTSVIKYGLTSGNLSSQVTGFSTTGNSPNIGTASISSLQENTTYYYQIEATNSAGTITSSISSFTTTIALTPQMIANYEFNNSYNNINGNTPFSTNAGISFTTDRHGNVAGAINIGGTGTSATIPNLPYGNSARTIAFWAKVNTMRADYNMTFSYGATGTGNSNGGSFIAGSNWYLGYNDNFSAATTNTVSTWYFFTYTYDGTTAKIYKNGILLGSSVKSWNTLNNADLFKLGVGVGGELWFDGAIDDLKIYNYVLNDTEILSLHNTNSLPITPQNIATYTFNNTYQDKDGGRPFASNSGTSFVADRFNNPNSAININNTGTTANILGLPYGNTARSIAVWVKLNNSGQYNFVYNYGTGITANGTLLPNATSVTNFGGSQNHSFNTPTTVGTWFHYVFTFDGATSRIYKNGTLISSFGKSLNTANNSNIFRLGLSEDGTPNYFNGAIDDLYIYNFSLSATEVANLYNNNTLPVNLISYTAKTQNNSALLNWETASETNNSHFVIKKSIDGVSFNEIAKVDAKSNNGAKYQYLDNSTSNGTNYYQLLQVDLDGKTTNLGVKALEFNLSASNILLYPNPVKNELNISFEAAKYHTLALYNLSGQLIYNSQITKSTNHKAIDISLVPKGIYVVKLIGNHLNITQKIIKN